MSLLGDVIDESVNDEYIDLLKSIKGEIYSEEPVQQSQPTTAPLETTTVLETTTASEITTAATTPTPQVTTSVGIHKDEKLEVVTPLSEMSKYTVFWGHTGDKVHINPDCRTFKNGVLYGSLDTARNNERYDWCGMRGCSSDMTDTKFNESGNPKIT